MKNLEELVQPVRSFLLCKTPDAWVSSALENIDTLLIDHANCEKKAAAVAASLMNKYLSFNQLQQRLSKLAREELRHFEQVHKIMLKRKINYIRLSPSRYASGLREGVRPNEPQRLADTLIVCAIIEARSCERFYVLAPRLDAELQKFYSGLLASESRHFELYLNFAREHFESEESFNARVSFFLALDQNLIQSKDDIFRFHSGVLA